MNNSPLYDLSIVNQKLPSVLAKMNQRGVTVDVKVLLGIGVELKKEIYKLEMEINSLISCQINLNSPKQVADILFNKLKLPSGRKGKTGFSTDEKTLLRLRDKHAVIDLILKYRNLSKLLNTYVEPLPLLVAKDGRIHSTFIADGSITGRIASHDPILQNIPTRSAWGQKIRSSFKTSKDLVFLSADYSQIELRVLAHYSEDQKLVDSFKHQIDIHTATAADIFHKDLSLVTEEDRRVAKTVNFGIIYGLSAHGLSESLNISLPQATQYIQKYFESYQGVRRFIDKSHEQVAKLGYVITLGGLKKMVPEIKSESRFTKLLGKRLSINYPIQGSAAEIIKIAMCNIDCKLENNNLNAKLILQIHDELLYEVPNDELVETSKLVKYEMEKAVSLLVPLEVHLKVGNNWGEMNPYGDE